MIAVTDAALSHFKLAVLELQRRRNLQGYMPCIVWTSDWPSSKDAHYTVGMDIPNNIPKDMRITVSEIEIGICVPDYSNIIAGNFLVDIVDSEIVIVPTRDDEYVFLRTLSTDSLVLREIIALSR
ncbi:MAG: hypothetical protein U1E62_13020 [Alsobacter sp.]